MTTFGMGIDKKNFKIFLIGSKQEEEFLRNVLFEKIGIPENGIYFLFDKKNGWIACEIECYSKEDFNCVCQLLLEHIQ